MVLTSETGDRDDSDCELIYDPASIQPHGILLVLEPPVLKILQAETKKRLESAEIYTQAGRTEAAAQESAEAEILSRYLPAAMGDDELLVIVTEEVAAAVAAGNEGAKAMGLVVKAVRARAGSSADGAKIAALVKSALG